MVPILPIASAPDRIDTLGCINRTLLVRTELAHIDTLLLINTLVHTAKVSIVSTLSLARIDPLARTVTVSVVPMLPCSSALDSIDRPTPHFLFASTRLLASTRHILVCIAMLICIDECF